MPSVWEQTGLPASGLMGRWGMQGYNFGDAQATRIATLIHSNGISNVVDIDYIKRTAGKSLMHGFNHKDIQLLVGVQFHGGNQWYSLVHTRDAEVSLNASFIRRDVISERLEFYLAKWCSVQSQIGDLFPEQKQVHRWSTIASASPGGSKRPQ